jgi:phospholipid/cholesterol/gamma-HCH transport system ATP-binding protein
VASVLRFDRATVRFDDKPALVDISFEVRAGETIVLYGAAGSGKTVLLKTAIGLICPEEGRTYLFGQDITGLREEELYLAPSRGSAVPGRRTV